MAYDDRFERTPSANRTAREIPETVVAGIIQDAEQASAALQFGEVHQMKSYQERFRLLNSFPAVFWQTGTDDVLGGSGDGGQVAKDSAFKKTTKMDWTNAYLVPNEIAVITAMPDSWRDDSDLAWEEVRRALKTAVAKAIDAAVLFGRSDYGPLPGNWGLGVVAEAIAAGNEYAEGTGVDLADDYAAFFQASEEQGTVVKGAITAPAQKWRLVRTRTADGVPIYSGPADGEPGGSVYGVPLTPVENGVWETDNVTALAGDRRQLHIGIRQDMQWTMSNSASLYDPSDGSLIYAPFQQDGELLRVTMRLGYVVTSPLKHITGEHTYPFSVMTPAAPSS